MSDAEERAEDNWLNETEQLLKNLDRNLIDRTQLRDKSYPAKSTELVNLMRKVANKLVVYADEIEAIMRARMTNTKNSPDVEPKQEVY